MLTRFLSRLRRVAPVTRPIQNVRPRALSLEALEAREVPAIIYALNGSTINQLLRFDSATPGTVTTTTVTGLAAGDKLQGIDFRPRTGQLVGITFPNMSMGSQPAKTYTINPLTGAATLVGTSGAVVNGSDDVSGDIDFNPTVDRIRYVGGDGTLTGNARLNPNNGGLVANDTGITPLTTVLIGAAYDRNFDRQSTTIPTTLYAISRDGFLGTVGSVDGAPNSPNGGVFTIIGGLGVTPSNTNEGGFDIAVSPANGGKGTAFAALTVGTTTGLYTINLTTGAATLVGNIGNGTNEIFDIAVVPDSIVVVGSGLGARGDVRILDATTGATVRAIAEPFVGFQGGVNVASGDVTGDGIPDVIVAAQAPNGHVKVFNGATGAEIRSFFAFNGFNGTVVVASGDVNGDGFDDIIVGANGVAGGHVKVFSGNPAAITAGTGVPAELASFFSFSESGNPNVAGNGFRGNLSLASADFNNDGLAEVVAVASFGGAPTKVFSIANGVPSAFTSSTNTAGLSSFLAFPGSPNVQFNVAAGDLNGDGIPDIAIVSGAGTNSNVRVINGGNPLAGVSAGQTNSYLTSFLASPGEFFGSSIALSDANSDGLLDIRITPGVGKAAQLFTFNLNGTQLNTATNTFTSFLGGSTVGGSRF